MNQESGEGASPDPKARAPVKTGRAIMLFSVAAVAIAVTGVVGRRHDDEQIAKWTDEQAVETLSWTPDLWDFSAQIRNPAGD